MRRYLGVWFSQTNPTLNDARELSVSHTGHASTIAERQLEMLRRHSHNGPEWDSWAVLFQFGDSKPPKVMATGHVDA